MTITNVFTSKNSPKQKAQINQEKIYLLSEHFFALIKLIYTQIDLFYPLKKWLDNLEISDSNTAHRICKFIPSQCPFARDIIIFNHKIATIPPLCKLNPLYENLIALKFRSMVYLADICGEDISVYY